METKILTLIIAAGGWIVVIIQAVFGFLERQKKHKDDILLKATEYFVGGTQKRSIGISLIEGMIKANRKYYDVVIPLLTNQFVYLLLQSDTQSQIHEERNVVRIFFLIKDLILSDKSRYHRDKCELLDAIGRQLEGTEKSTLKIAKGTLELWKQELE
ncbi:MAG: hypothetical protein WC446_07170 [Candidatus Paceibacterota bacterium]|jgi:hypothetical protein